MGGSGEFVECLGGGVVVEGGSGAVARDFSISDVGALQSINRIPIMVGQTRLQPRHDCSVIQSTKHPTTPHNQPPTSITATRKLLTPYDTAQFGPRLCLWAWVLHPIRRQCTRSDRV